MPSDENSNETVPPVGGLGAEGGPVTVAITLEGWLVGIDAGKLMVVIVAALLTVRVIG